MSAFEGAQLRLSGLVSGDIALSASQFRFVQMDTGLAGAVARAATAGQRGLVGVIQDKPTLVGDPCLVVGGGITKVEAGVALTKGCAVMTDASGRAITAAASAANHIYGYALEAASAAGSLAALIFAYHGPVTNNS